MLVQKVNYDNNQWDFPGGGTDEGETGEQAVLRELTEELGTNKFELIAKSKHVLEFEWPDAVIERKQKEGMHFRGQIKEQFLVRFTGSKADIVFDTGELKQVKWVTLDNLEEHLVFEKQWEEAQLVLAEFELQK